MSEAELVKRLERLERDNRRLKRLGVAAVVIVAALGLMAATNPVPNKITAHEFDVVDSAGKTQIRLKTFAEGASIIISPDLEPAQDGKENTPVVSMGTNGGRSWLTLGYLGWFKAPKTQPFVGLESFMDLQVSRAKGSSIRLRDGQGYSMDLGSTSLVTPATGETHHTSAASIVMFGNVKDHKVIWQAPQP